MKRLRPDETFEYQKIIKIIPYFMIFDLILHMFINSTLLHEKVYYLIQNTVCNLFY